MHTLLALTATIAQAVTSASAQMLKEASLGTHRVHTRQHESAQRIDEGILRLCLAASGL